MSGNTEYIWVLGAWDPRSDRGKAIQGLADHGVGYIIQNPDRMKSDRIIAAFKYPAGQEIPRHLNPATPQQTERLEQRSQHGKS